MQNALHWLDRPWRGRVGIGPRPRRDDWLSDEVGNWKRAGVNAVLSLLTADEERELGLAGERRKVTGQGIKFSSFPIADRRVPTSETGFAQMIANLDRDLESGKNVLVHCRQGIGRSGLVAACLLIGRGSSPGAAVGAVSAARGTAIPDTEEQREWIDNYAVVLGPK